MIHIRPFAYKPTEHENERAGNSYLMSVIAIMMGLPLPILNLIATFFFYVANRNSTDFVRWHCTQALLSQFTLLLMNSAAVFWTISIIFRNWELSNLYISYMMVVVLYNLAEFAATVYSSVQVRKGLHVKWWFYGAWTDFLIKPS